MKISRTKIRPVRYDEKSIVLRVGYEKVILKPNMSISFLSDPAVDYLDGKGYFVHTDYDSVLAHLKENGYFTGIFKDVIGLYVGGSI